MTSNLVIVGVQNRDVSENISLLVQIYTDGCRIDPHWPDVTWRRLMSWCVTIRAWCTKWGMGRRMQLCDLKPGLGKGKQTVKRKKSILLVFYLLVYSVYTVLEKRFWMENLVKKLGESNFLHRSLKVRRRHWRIHELRIPARSGSTIPDILLQLIPFTS